MSNEKQEPQKLQKLQKLFIEFFVATWWNLNDSFHQEIIQKLLINKSKDELVFINRNLQLMKPLKRLVQSAAVLELATDFVYELPSCFAEELAGDTYSYNTKPATLSDNLELRLYAIKTNLISKNHNHLSITIEIMRLNLANIVSLSKASFRVLKDTAEYLFSYFD